MQKKNILSASTADEDGQNFFGRGTFSRETIENLTAGCRFGSPLYLYRITDSTNIRAKKLAKGGCPDGTTVLAAAQNAGTGSRGRVFYSPDGGIYLSAVARNCGKNIALITSMCAVAVARAIESVSGAEVKIKWVNDLLINGKKICGILAESGITTGSDAHDYCVIGIGVNCARQEFPCELSDIATSIGNECGTTVSLNILAACILRELDNGFQNMSNRRFLNESRARSAILGKDVTITRNRETFIATAINIEDDGALLVKKDGGETELLNFGEVSVKI